jgi:cytidylate kinase
MKSQKNKITIAIDGYSSCGKSTLAKDLANELNAIYIDTGAMYRGVTLFAKRNNWVGENFIKSEEIIRALPQIEISFKKEPNKKAADLLLNGENVENEIRTLEISNLVSEVSAIKEVREKLVSEQRKMGEKGGVILDGRDIGSVVFPDAELKLFVTADPEIRAARRLAELRVSQPEIKFADVLENLNKRDYLDSTRAESPLVQTSDALVLDNSNLDQKEQLMWVLSKICEILKH